VTSRAPPPTQSQRSRKYTRQRRVRARVIFPCPLRSVVGSNRAAIQRAERDLASCTPESDRYNCALATLQAACAEDDTVVLHAHTGQDRPTMGVVQTTSWAEEEVGKAGGCCGCVGVWVYGRVWVEDA
jgi:hypothetical protein